MDRTDNARPRPRRILAGAAMALALALLASPTVALGATSGAVTIRPAAHGAGRTLSGQGVEILAGAGATGAANAITLPITSLQASGTTPWAQTPAALTFTHGKRSLTLTQIRFEFAAGTLTGTLAGRQLPVFRLGTAVDVYPTTGTIAFSGGRLRLTTAAATLLRNKLHLERPLLDRGVGQVSMIATSPPPPPDNVPPPVPPEPPSPVVEIPPPSIPTS